MPTRDMTYLFVLIGLPVINAGLLAGAGWSAVVMANLVIVVVLYVLEKGWGFHYEQSQRITYERVDLVKRGQTNLLLEDLRQRTGLDIKRLEIGHINYLRDSTEIKIYYDDPVEGGWNDEDSPDFINEEAVATAS